MGVEHLERGTTQKLLDNIISLQPPISRRKLIHLQRIIKETGPKIKTN